MTKFQPERLLIESISGPLAQIGFVLKRGISFVRDNGEPIEILSFGGRKDRTSFYFGCSVGLRFDSVEKILRPENIDETYPTIMTPIHLLHEDSEYFEWELTPTNASGQLINGVLMDVVRNALPFFDKYRNLRDVRRELESSGCGKRFVLTPEQRILTLAGISVVQGDPKGALVILEEALEQRQGALPKKRAKLESLRARLLA